MRRPKFEDFSMREDTSFSNDFCDYEEAMENYCDSLENENEVLGKALELVIHDAGVLIHQKTADEIKNNYINSAKKMLKVVE